MPTILAATRSASGVPRRPRAGPGGQCYASRTSHLVVRRIRAVWMEPSGADRVIRELTGPDYHIRLDVTEQVLEISLLERPGAWSSETADEEPLQPTPDYWSGFRPLDPADRAPQFVAAAMLVHKARQFDEGLCAAVDLAAQRGTGAFPGKGQLLERLATRLAERGDADAAQALILASGHLGALPLRVAPQLAEAVDVITASFL